ncbi:MAG: hypothetical protein LV480_01340 [Methylacidiphilales bacterium]|nr:hypothetical protein [Candidatus Methylacidiphilales bacterium]
MKLRIQHRTTYRYAEKVFFGPHPIMLRPREVGVQELLRVSHLQQTQFIHEIA